MSTGFLLLLDGASGDTTAPIADITSTSRTKMSRVAGADSTDITFTTDEAFVEYDARLVPGTSSPKTAGTSIETATVSSRTSHSITVTDDELVAAGATEGNLIVKIFARDAAGNWSA